MSSPTNDYCITYQDVLEAKRRIEKYVHKTPVLSSTSINAMMPSGKKLFFKTEALQKTGSFKFRGATNATLSLKEQYGDDGKEELHLVTHSSGNHAQALALAAKLTSSSATIVMPENAPQIKKDAVIDSYQANVVLVESTNEARESKADEIIEENKKRGKPCFFIHPSEDPKVIAGQGTAALELVSQMEEIYSISKLDAIIIPVGGGGLASGNTIALRGIFGDKIKIILAEPKELNDAKRSKDAGKLLKHDPSNRLNSVADGLKTTLGKNTWPIVRDLVDNVITVSETEILRATKLTWERLKISIEPSAGVGVAVALGDEFDKLYGNDETIKNVGIILCGGNADIIKISQLMGKLGL